jgi:four helix bundle protein
MEVKNFEDLQIWQYARKLAISIKKMIDGNDDFKTDFRLKDQIKASSGSVMDNIAEGFERGGNKEFIQFLYIAKGSLGETRSQLYRCFDYGYCSEEMLTQYTNYTKRLSAMIYGMIKSLKNTDFKGEKYKEG